MRARPASLLVNLGLAATGVAATYHALMTVAAGVARSSGGSDTLVPVQPVHRFCVLVPAHDEEQGIGSTLDSLRALDYPAEMVRFHVVADHCTDGTAAVVRSCGMEVHEHGDPLEPGKGPALQWLLARLDDRGDDFDAVVFVDADSVVDRAFLRVADGHLARGADVVQSHYAVRDPGISPAVAYRAAAMAARHYLRPLGRAQLGCSAGLFGNGMIFRREVLARHAWSSHLTEDIELHLDLLLHDVAVTFAPDALIEGEMPATLEAATSQHERWERGRLDTARRFVPPLVQRAIVGGPLGRRVYADAMVDQVMPPLSVVMVAQVAVAVASGIRWVISPGRPTRCAGILALAGTAVHVVYVFAALRLTGAPRSVYRSLFSTPRFVVWKFTLWSRVLVGRRDIAWIRTRRNEERVP